MLLGRQRLLYRVATAVNIMALLRVAASFRGIGCCHSGRGEMAKTKRSRVHMSVSSGALQQQQQQSQVILMRHGETHFNERNLFTGWCDADVTPKGEMECREAGKLLKAAGIDIDVAHTSVLKRASKSLYRLLEGAEQTHVPIKTDWRLNERHYGALQGYSKGEMERRLGSVVREWRRGSEVRPPPMEKNHPYYRRIIDDPRYKNITVPASESLLDTRRRIVDYWESSVVPDISSGKSVLVVGHANSLRSLILHLDGLDDASIRRVEIATGRPFLYNFDTNMEPIGQRDAYGFRGKYIELLQVH